MAEQLEAWPAGIRAGFLRIAELMQMYRPDIGMPHTKAMGAGLFEVRARGREGTGRTFYCTLAGERIVILHAIIKKTDRTPARELAKARARQKEVQA